MASPSPEPLTPDFYRYRWIVPSSVALDGRFVRVEWPDGAALDAFDLWLAENAVGAGGIDPATREALIDPADLGDDLAVLGASLAPDGRVVIEFSGDRRVAVFHPGWLHHVATGGHLADAWLPAPQPWTAAELGEPPSHDGPAVLVEDAALGRFLDDLLVWGLARLRGLPDDPDIAGAVAGRIGAIRETNFGTIWDVKADIALAGSAETNSTANSNLRLGPHTDLPTRETPPGFQFLHCLVNDTQGGWSTMADGYAVAAALEADHPDDYEALITLKWVFFNRGPGIDHRWSGPLIDLGIEGAPTTLRAFYPVRGFPDMDPADMPRAYRAIRRFSRLADEPRFRLAYPFAPGDLVAFDNRRILHGRDAYETGGARHLRGLYMDHDEIRSTARVANRARAEESDQPLGRVTADQPGLRRPT